MASGKSVIQRNFQSDHSFKILSNLNSDRKFPREFCDITICVDDHEWHVHKCVVGGYSDFYSKMFTNKMKEKHESRVTLQGVSIETMESIINFIYTCAICVSMDNVYDLLTAADYMQLPYLKKYCVEFLMEVASPENCLSIKAYAKLCNETSLLEKADKIITENLELVINEQEFENLQVDELSELFQMKEKSDSVCHITSVQYVGVLILGVCTSVVWVIYELQLSTEMKCSAMIGWIKYDAMKRKEHLSMLFNLIQIESLSESFLQNLFIDKNVERDLGCSSQILQSALNDVSKEIALNERNPKHSISALILGGTDCDRQVVKYDITNARWCNMPTLNHNHTCASAVNNDDAVYVLGGDNSKVVERLRLNQPLKWEKVAHLGEVRRDAAAAVCKDRIYITGGRGCSCHSGEDYNIESNKWTSISDMNDGRWAHAMVTLNGLLYAIGGGMGTLDHSSVECFDPEIGVWKYVSPMKTARWGVAAVTLNSEIYAIGGHNDVDGTLSSAEKYDPNTDTWSDVASMIESRRFPASFVAHQRIYAMGGVGSTSVEIYDPLKDEWKSGEEMEEIRNHSCAVVI